MQRAPMVPLGCAHARHAVGLSPTNAEIYAVIPSQDTERPSERFPLIEGIRVDVEALRRLHHACDPNLCRHTQCCCKSYEILVDRREARTVVGVMPHAARYAPRLRDGETFHDPFDATEGGLCLASGNSGRCVFAFNTRQGLRCSLHAAALDLGLPPAAVKPKACSLWPLFFDETDPPLLTVQLDALEFPCNRRDDPAELDPGVEAIIRDVFGAPFLDAVREHLAPKPFGRPQ